MREREILLIDGMCLSQVINLKCRRRIDMQDTGGYRERVRAEIDTYPTSSLWSPAVARAPSTTTADYKLENLFTNPGNTNF